MILLITLSGTGQLFLLCGSVPTPRIYFAAHRLQDFSRQPTPSSGQAGLVSGPARGLLCHLHSSSGVFACIAMLFHIILWLSAGEHHRDGIEHDALPASWSEDSTSGPSLPPICRLPQALPNSSDYPPIPGNLLPAFPNIHLWLDPGDIPTLN